MTHHEKSYSHFRNKGRDWLKSIPRPLHAWLVPAAIVVLWQAAGGFGWISASLLPTPLTIAKQFASLGPAASCGSIFGSVSFERYRAFARRLDGSGSGIVHGAWQNGGAYAGPFISNAAYRTALIADSAVYSMVRHRGILEDSHDFPRSLFPIYVNTFLGIRSVDAKLYEVSRIFQYSKLQLLIRLIVPAALPNILLGIRLSLGVSWLVLVVAEMMGTSAGIGYMIQDARAYSQTDIVFVGIIIFAVVGKLSDSVVRRLESRLLGWRETYKG